MQKDSIKSAVGNGTDRWVCSVAIIFGCLVMLFWWYTRTSLWEDEIIAITHANQPFPLFFIEMLRSDIHPPLYFLQLKIWHDIGMTSDAAVLFNSVLCSLISLALLFYIARKVYGEKTAYYSAALFALMPIFAYGGGNLRMYGLMPACVLMVWYSNRNWFVTRERKWLVWAVIFEGVTSYVHAIEFFFVGFIAMAACAECVFRAHHDAGSKSPDRNTGLVAWIGAQFIVLVAILPLMGSAVIRGSEAVAPAGLFGLLTEPGALITGWAPADILPLKLAGLVIFIFLTAAAMRESRSRTRTLVAVIATLIVAMAVSMLAKPMIKIPVFASNLVPLLALGAGAGIATARSRYWRLGAFSCMIMLASAALPLLRYQMTPDRYGETGRLVKELARPGDVVIVPNVSVYWGIMRYAVGENWAKPLSILPLEANAQWNAVFNRLGPEATERLGLRPDSNHVKSKNVTYIIGEDGRQMTVATQRVWVIQRNGYQVNAQLGARFVRESVTYGKFAPGSRHDDLAISLFTRNESGEAIGRHPLNFGNK